jgi:AraC family transcriptional regulator, regulatory protein of adaptative response / DNA-3-methyladenine glycosylase II
MFAPEISVPGSHVRKRRVLVRAQAHNARMELDSLSCYRAVTAKDARFDGRFFVAVTSTRIYCRPVCRVKTPMQKNCRFFQSAAAAEAAGFRPCLRCRPELAPGNAAVDANSRLARAAANLLEHEALNGAGIEAMAARLGVTDRHLRRVFDGEFGVTPIAFLQTQRLLLAKRLLTDTSLPITQIALASGFNSVRRFNALFRSRYRLNPSGLRKVATRASSSEALSFELAYRPPYDWPHFLDFLERRAIEGVEVAAHGHEGTYRRTARIVHADKAHHGWIAIAPLSRKAALRVSVSVSLAHVVPAVLARVKQLTDLACNPAEVAQALGALGGHAPGVRVPGAFDGFEIAVRAILGQQVSVKAARTLAKRFAAAFGERITTPWPELAILFPPEQRIAECTLAQIAQLGIVGARAKTIIALARALAEGKLRLDPSAPLEATLDALRDLPGVGEWTAQYIAMRALGWPDAFPHSDLGVMKALGAASPRGALAASEKWRPWRAYAVMHLWNSLAAPSPS